MAEKETKELTVSVIIPNYNYGRFLSQAIESVLSQSVPCKEIIVVDDGSTDNSLDILDRYKERVNVVRQSNCGVGFARNVGVHKSSGDIVAFLDADDYWFPQKIEKQVESFLADEEIGLVTCGMQEFDGNGVILQNHNQSISGWVADKIAAFNNPIIASGSAIAIRRNVFEKAGGFDTRKELHPSEDWEFCYRIARVNKIAFVPELLVHYRNHGNNGHLKIPRMEKAMLLAYQKIFNEIPPENKKLKRESYANLYSVLAGSYYHAGDHRRFIRSLFKSIWYKPLKIKDYLKFSVRFLKHNKKQKQAVQNSIQFDASLKAKK